MQNICSRASKTSSVTLAAIQRRMTIFYTSHNMQEVERMSDRILFLLRGRLIADGPPGEVLRQFARESLEEMFLEVTRHGAAS